MCYLLNEVEEVLIFQSTSLNQQKDQIIVSATESAAEKFCL